MGWDGGGEDGSAFGGVWEKVIGCFVFGVLKYIEAVSVFDDVRLLLFYQIRYYVLRCCF